MNEVKLLKFSESDEPGSENYFAVEDLVRFADSSAKFLQSFSLPESVTGTYQGILGALGPEKLFDAPAIFVLILKGRGNAYFKSNDYENALLCYKEVFKGILKDGRESLAINFYHEDYLAIMAAKPSFDYLIPLLLALVSCCNNIAQVYLKLHDYSNVSILAIASTNRP